jgi:ABC-type transport system substrate-binding protein
VAAILVLVYLILACNPYKEPAPTPIAALPTVPPNSTPESASTLASPVDSPIALPDPAPTGGSLRLYGLDPVTLDPALAGDINSHEYIAKVFSGLVRMSADLEILPDIAERWPVTAEDVKYSIERACEPDTGSQLASSYLGDIIGALDKLNGRASQVAGVEVLDDHTLRIRTDASKAYFLAKLTYPTSFVVDREQVEGASVDWWKQANGTGPFHLERFDLDSIVLHANDDFYRGQPSLDEVIYHLTGGGAVGQYERGELDVAPVSVADIDRVLDPGNPFHEDLVVVHSLDTWYLTFNTAVPPFDDPKVRLAFAYATNKQAMADIVLNKTVRPAEGILPPDMPGYNEDLEGIPFDPDMALELLNESRYADGLPPIVFTVSGQGSVGAMDEALAESYRQTLGAKIEIQQMSWSRFLEGLNERQFQMFSLGWIADYADPENFLDLLFHSSSHGNHMAYSNPEADVLLERARTEPDRQTRLSLYQQVEEMLVWDVAWIPLYHGIDYQLVKPYVKGLVLSPQGFYFLENVVVESP